MANRPLSEPLRDQQQLASAIARLSRLAGSNGSDRKMNRGDRDLITVLGRRLAGLKGPMASDAAMAAPSPSDARAATATHIFATDAAKTMRRHRGPPDTSPIAVQRREQATPSATMRSLSPLTGAGAAAGNLTPLLTTVGRGMAASLARDASKQSVSLTPSATPLPSPAANLNWAATQRFVEATPDMTARPTSGHAFIPSAPMLSLTERLTRDLLTALRAGIGATVTPSARTANEAENTCQSQQTPGASVPTTLAAESVAREAHSRYRAAVERNEPWFRRDSLGPPERGC